MPLALSQPPVRSPNPNNAQTFVADMNAAFAYEKTIFGEMKDAQVLIPGDFGIGTDAPASAAANLNNQRINGAYGFANTATNAPPQFFSGGVLHVSSQSATRTVQIAIEHDTGRMARRYISDSGTTPNAWSAWRLIDGDTGSNANGNYTRLINGWQSCTITMTSLASGATTWTFPAAFVAAPPGLGGIPLTGGGGRTLSTSFISATSLSFSVWDASSVRQAHEVRLTAVGRWY